MVKLKINNKEISTEPGTSVLKAALDNGIYIPHFCYHPALSVSGNCRLCVVKIKNTPKPVTACTTLVAEGMEVETEGEEISRIRKSVLEFILINHPLDCPVCDQAGECTLQDYTFLYGKDHSRFSEKKNIYHTKDIGPLVKLWGNRCIVCARCVRFLNEITRTGELGIMDRGDKCVIDTFPGIPVDNPLSGNIVDICPVGALISKDFLYQARVWFMNFSDSICPMCATGCNIKIGVYQGTIKRFTTRANPKLNQYWICDYGRMSYKYIQQSNRLTEFQVRENSILLKKTNLEYALHLLKSKLTGKTAVIASAFLDNEGLTALKSLTEKLGTNYIGCLLKPDGAEQTFGGGFKISRDKNPNRKGFEKIFGAEILNEGYKKALEAMKNGSADSLYYIGGTIDYTLPKELTESVDKLRFIAVQDTHSNWLIEKARVVIPVCSYAEKDGTFINEQGIEQRFRRAVEPAGAIETDKIIFTKLM